MIITFQYNENHEMHRIHFQNHDHQTNLIIIRQKHENHEIHRIPFQNHGNHENLIIACENQ